MTARQSAPLRPASAGTVDDNPLQTIDLDISGMTCASCAARIEKKLNRLPGVTASVNYATEKAHVSTTGTLDPGALIDTVTATGYGATLPVPDPPDTPDDGTAVLRTRLRVSAALALPVLLLAMIPAWQFTSWQWVALVLATPVATWGAWPFHRAAWRSARHGGVGMDTLISVGVSAAYLWSVYALLFTDAGQLGMTMPFEILPRSGGSALYFEVAAAVTVFLLAGRYAEAKAKRRSGAALQALLSIGVNNATVLRDGREVRVPIAVLAVGDEFVVRPGETIATDGVVTAGSSAVDVSLLTGESLPAEVEPGGRVFAGTVNTTGRLVVRAETVGSGTQLAKMAALVAAAQSGKAEIARLADRISAVFVPIVIVLSLLTLAGWLLFTGDAGPDVERAFTAAVSVLIIACPCALGLATPTALLVGTGRGAQLGVLIRGPQILESTRRIDTVVLDKTGTVTTGTMTLQEVHPLASADPSGAEALRLVGALESASEHPVARALTTAASAAGPLGDHRDIDFRSTPGGGVVGTVEGHAVVAGRPAWLASDFDLPLPPAGAEIATAAEVLGRTVIAAAVDGAMAALFVIGDQIKPTSAQAVARFRRLGLEPVLLTGDNAGAARTVAAGVGIDRVIADVRPADKLAAIHELQAQGRIVAMIGDGVNDAPALAGADLGMAMGSGADAAIEAADITIVSGDLRAAADAVELSRATLTVIKQNLFWAFAYNVAALPLAVAGLASPVIAGAAMAASSVLVVGNSLRLRRFRGSRSSAAPSARR